MNTLTLVLYLADLVQSLSIFFGILGVALAATTFFGTLHRFDKIDNQYEWHYEDSRAQRDVKRKPFAALYIRQAKQAAAAVFLLWAVAIFLPSKDTVYAMIASESVTRTDTGTKAMKALDAWLDRQITPPADQK